MDNSAVGIPEQLFSECERIDELNQTLQSQKETIDTVRLYRHR